MKKLLLVCTVLALGLASASAQSSFGGTTTNASNTITNTGIDTMKYTIASTAYYPVIGVQLVITKASGTLAGTAVLLGSLDGTNFVAAGSDTLTLANSTTNTKYWKLTSPAYKYYQIRIGGSTTVSATAVAKIYALKP